MDMRVVKKAGLAMGTSFRHLSYLIVGSSAFGYKSDEHHFVLGIIAFGTLQLTALLLSIIWGSLDVEDE